MEEKQKCEWEEREEREEERKEKRKKGRWREGGTVDGVVWHQHCGSTCSIPNRV